MAEYIEREAYCAYLKSRTAEFLDDYGKGWSNGIISARRIALKFPAADVAPVVHGHFVHDGPRFAGGVDWWRCSACGGLASGAETQFAYCPNCGAKMDGGDRDAAD